MYPSFSCAKSKSTAPRQVCAPVLLPPVEEVPVTPQVVSRLAFLPTCHSHHGIVGFCLRPFAEGQRSMLTAQDCLSYNIQEGVQLSVMEAVSEGRL